KFSTPPPKLARKFPEGGPVRRDPVVFIEFDQKIDPEAVLRKLTLRAGGQALGARLATPEEIAADESVKSLAASAVEGRWLAVRAASAQLPQASLVTVSVGAGTPSAEGPRVTTTAQEFSFRTFGPLRVTGTQCGWQRRCTPFDTWQIEFTNPLDQKAFDKSQVRFEPELPGAQIQIYGSMMHVAGAKRGRTTYKVTFDRSLRDVFGQTLEGPASVTFNVGAAEPGLVTTGDWFAVIEPSARPAYSVYSINHDSLKVSIYKVAPEQWHDFVAYMRGVNNYYDARRGGAAQTAPPGKLVFSKAVAVKAQPDELVETPIDLAPALEGGLGNAVVIVEPAVRTAVTRRDRQVVRVWAQVTGIGLDAFADQKELVGWATSLRDGRPLAGVELGLLPSGARGRTGADGLARMPLPDAEAPAGNVLVARSGGDTAFITDLYYWGAGGRWRKTEARDTLRWYVFDDRKMYRPGEEVSVKGWIRRVGAGEGGDVGALDGAAEVVNYVVRDSRGNEIGKGSAQLNALGGFDTRFKLPAGVNLGRSHIQFDAGGGQAVEGRQYHHHFQIQEFRRPEFEVTAQASEGPHFVGSHADATVSANYYAGGGLAGAEVTWNVTASPAQYTPPNRGDFTFGRWVPWWGWRGAQRREGETTTQTFGGRTDASGKHRLRIDFDSVRPPQPSTVTATASVADVNRQQWAGTTTMLVHPADIYVGIRSPRTFVQQGEPLIVESIVTDLDGRLIPGRDVRVRAALLEWVQEKGEWKQKETPLEDCALKSGGEPVKCTFRPKAGGTYRVTATVLDDRERPNESELTLWVAGGRRPAARGVEQESVDLIPDRKEYRAGETAEILVQAPFFPAEAVMTLRRSGLVRTERFRMDEPTRTLKVPIEEAFTPNVHVQVDLVGATARLGAGGEPDEKLPKRPAFASGSLDLSVPPLARKLRVTATPREAAVEPGAETSVSVEVRDASGSAVRGSELAVVVVDESVLALTGYKLEDPVSVFYARREPGVSDHHLRSELVLVNPEMLETVNVQSISELPVNARMAPPPPSAGAMADEAEAVGFVQMKARGRASNTSGLMLGGAAPGGDDAAIRLRENFNALAVFAPSVLTDSSGRAEVKVKIPDNLTRYRVMAVSVAGGKQFGSGESSITARVPLMVRPSAPRFLNFGDRFELPVVVQNQTDKPLVAEVAARASNAEFTDGAGRRVTVPANDRVEVRLPAAAARAGVARFQVGAVSGRFADAAQVELPVWTPATTEAFATYGELDGNAAVVQPVRAPSGVLTQF
ncbi:MAG TPA: alpha-2-macroglobulin family protein, partial [Pyrinomonadaceae bacterium]|nr:alpha-2-macroglobulin family protein [Pyrinomonadaceae bacterium]